MKSKQQNYIRKIEEYLAKGIKLEDACRAAGISSGYYRVLKWKMKNSTVVDSGLSSAYDRIGRLHNDYMQVYTFNDSTAAALLTLANVIETSSIKKSDVDQNYLFDRIGHELTLAIKHGLEDFKIGTIITNNNENDAS